MQKKIKIQTFISRILQQNTVVERHSSKSNMTLEIARLYEKGRLNLVKKRRRDMQQPILEDSQKFDRVLESKTKKHPEWPIIKISKFVGIDYSELSVQLVEFHQLDRTKRTDIGTTL